MALIVDEVMNRELFSLPPGEPVERALQEILGLGITAAPVLDPERRPVGMVALRDLVDAPPESRVGERMTRPAVTVIAGTRIADAARLLGMTGLHHATVVNAEGVAVGFLSILDLMRGLVGIPTGHPIAFPHFDPRTGLTWTDDTVFDLEHVEVAPDGPGLFVLIHGGADRPETVVWADGANNVQAHLCELLSTTQPPTLLGDWIEQGVLRFRAAPVEDPVLRQALTAIVRSETRGQLFRART